MGRRDFITLLWSLTAIAVRSAYAQDRSRPHRIGVLLYTASNVFRPKFVQALQSLGYMEGRDILLDVRDAGGRPARAAEQAASIVRTAPDLVVVWATGAAQAMRAATTTIPIVMWVADPLESGLVKNLARPEANLTGLSTAQMALAAKRVQVAAEALPGVRRMAFLGLEGEPNVARFLSASESGGRAAGVEIVPVLLHSPQEFEPAVTTAVQRGAGALVLQSIFNQVAGPICDLATRHGLPTIADQRQTADAGCLLAIGTNADDNYRRVAGYVDRILKGARPADLPIEEPTRSDLVINLNTARALAISIPPAILARADEVIE